MEESVEEMISIAHENFYDTKRLILPEDPDTMEEEEEWFRKVLKELDMNSDQISSVLLNSTLSKHKRKTEVPGNQRNKGLH